jgi:hypothetical protein
MNDGQGSLFDDEETPPILCVHCRRPIEWQEAEQRWMHVETRLSRCADGIHSAGASGASFHYDPQAHRRNEDPSTSDKAARRVRPESHMAKLLIAYAQAGNEGLTPQEAGMKAGVREEAAHKRVSDLKREGWIEPLILYGCRLERPNPGSGEDAEVLVITTLGTATIHRLGLQ